MKSMLWVSIIGILGVMVLGKPVLKTKKIDKLAFGHIDAPISSYTIKGRRFWIIPSVQWTEGSFEVYHTTLKGKYLKRGKKFDIAAQDTIIKSNGIVGKKWITSTHQHNNGVLAFIHVEYANGLTPQEARGPGSGRIGLAWWDTSGANKKTRPEFNYLGHIMIPDENRVNFNVMGTPYLIINGKFHIYYHEASQENQGWGHIGCSTANYSEVIWAAKKGESVQWTKIDKSMELWPTIVHSGAVTVEGVHYLTGYTPENWDARKSRGENNLPSEIMIYKSHNGLDWEQIHSISIGFGTELRYLSVHDYKGTPYIYAVKQVGKVQEVIKMNLLNTVSHSRK